MSKVRYPFIRCLSVATLLPRLVSGEVNVENIAVEV